MKFGSVSLMGRPNSGKSTLLNALLGVPVSGVSKRKQTTRNRIAGILTDDEYQIVFYDTPGITKEAKHLNKILNSSACGTLYISDIVVYMIDVKHYFHDQIMHEMIKKHDTVICCLNKIDGYERKKLLPLIGEISKHKYIKEIVPISALKKTNTDELIRTILNYLPEGEKMYPDDYISANPETFIIAETVKTAIFNLTRNEVPYGCAVHTSKMQEKEDIIVIDAVIYVDNDSKKGIIIGKNGNMIKDIGTSSRITLENIFQKRFYLSLSVKVKSHWQKNNDFLKMLGYV